MKFVRYFLSVLLLAALVAPLARGDGSWLGGDDDPMANDPNLVPKAFQPKTAITPEQLAAAKESRKKALDKKEWLMRGYAVQLQAIAKEKGPNSPDSVADLEESAALAKAAGLSVAEFPRVLGEEDLNAAAGEKTDATAPTRSTAVPLTPLSQSFINLKPFLSETASSLPPSAPPPLFSASSGQPDSAPDVLQANAPHFDNAKSPDSSDMDIPGLTAAESNPATKAVLGISDSDLLPGESPADAAKAHQPLELDLPPMTDSDRLAKLQSDALKVPGPVTKKAAPVAPAVPPPQPESDTEQMVHDPTPMRAHVDDPFDILH